MSHFFPLIVAICSFILPPQLGAQDKALLDEAVLRFSFDRDTWFHVDGKVFVKDLTKNKRHGEVLDGAACGSGRFGDALHLDGKTGCVFVPSESLDLQAFTLSAWIYCFESVPAADDAGVIIGTDCIFYYPTQRSASMRVEFLGKDRHRGLHQDGGKKWGPGLRHWRHMAATWDQKRVRLYADGKLVNETNDIVDQTQPNKESLAIGRWGGRAERHFRGMIDEVAVFSRALTESELVQVAGGDGATETAMESAAQFLWDKDRPIPGKIPEPGPEELAPAVRRLEAAFQQDIAGLTSDDSHLAFARQLLSSTREIPLSTAEWHAVMARAQNEAAAGGDVHLAFKTLDVLSNQSQTNVLAKKGEIISQASRAGTLSAAQLALLTQQTIALAGDLAASDSPAEGTSAVETMQAILSKSKPQPPPVLAERLAHCKQRVSRIQELHQAGTRAMKRLAENPADEDANATAGSYLCLVREEWTKGLPYLARGGEGALQAVADKELGDTSTREAQMELADAWWSVAAEIKEEKHAARLRAAYWYRIALPRLSGLSKAKAEKRIPEDKSAFVFDGKGRIVTALQRFAPVTLEAWVKAEPQKELYPLGDRRLLLGQIIGSDIPGRYGLGIGILDRKLAAEYIPGIMETQTAVPLGEWAHIAAVFSPGDTRLFLNGKLAGSGPATQISGGTKFVVSSVGLDNVGFFFSGQIRSVRISTGARYQENFDAPRILFPDANTLLLLDAASTRGSRAIDLSGNGNHGVLQGVVVAEEPTGK
ncbi:MAG: LamG domain-containing protein [Pirellulaceae bacterium]|nr:LamG domain-containing protein [Pirellulaceae bacterium]